MHFSVVMRVLLLKRERGGEGRVLVQQKLKQGVRFTPFVQRHVETKISHYSNSYVIKRKLFEKSKKSYQ